MDEVASRYLTALDELNLLTSTSYYQAEGQDLAKLTVWQTMFCKMTLAV